MPPVQIPTIESEGPAAPVKYAEAPTAVVDSQAADKATMQGFAGLANEGADYIQKIQNHAMEVQSIEANNKYEVQYRTALAEAKKMQGDPTAVYADIDDKREQWKNDILSTYSNASPRAIQMMKEKFQVADTSLRERQATQYGIQNETYQNNIGKVRTTLDSQIGLDSATSIRVDAPLDDSGTNTSLQPLQSAVFNMKKNMTVMNSDPSQGLVNSDGSISPILRMRQLNATSAMLKGVVNTLNNTGHPEEAKLVMDNFPDDILANDKTILSKEHETSTINKQSLQAVDEIGKKYTDTADQMAAAKRIPDLQVRAAAMKNLHIQQAEDAQSLQLSKKQLMNDASTYLSKNNYSSVDQMEADPKMQTYMDKMDNKQKNVLKQQLAPPPISSLKAQSNMYNLMFDPDNKLQGMSPGDAITATHDLNKADKNTFMNQWKMANDPSQGQQRALSIQAGTLLKQQMISMGAKGLDGGITKDAMTGRYNQEMDAKVIDAQEKMMESLRSMGPNAPHTVAAMNDFVIKHAQDFAKGVAFSGPKTAPSPTPLDGGATPTKAPEVTPTPPQETQVDANKRLDAFKKEYGHKFGDGGRSDSTLMNELRLKYGDKF
jgi:hypothetical protein